MHDLQTELNIPFPQQDRAISNNAKHLFEKNAFDIMFFAPSGTEPLTKEQILLGKKLFNDPILSSNGNRSCASCHQADKAFTDGLKLNESLSGGQKLLRNTPTLLNAALQPAQFYDSRISFLEDQIHDVISNRSEMDGNTDAIAQRLNENKNYKKLFLSAYNESQISSYSVKKAIAVYVRSLVTLNSPFDKYIRGDATAMKENEINGFNLFMGKAKCGTCHFIPLFTGAVPPLYQKMESEVLGVPTTTDTLNAVMDTDSGKYNLYNIPHQLHAFKTTTVRNAELTAPYMHNGVFNTLEEVIEFYDRGGGTGLGFDLANQTLSRDRLNLTAKEKNDLIVFIHALTDTTISY